jgi:hypothetical protein
MCAVCGTFAMTAGKWRSAFVSIFILPPAMSVKALLVTPPFTQLNTPYPATAYLKGFLNARGIPAAHADLGIEVTLAIFCRSGLTAMFALAAKATEPSDNAQRMLALSNDYINTVDAVVSFLQGKDPTMASRIRSRSFLPEASRFAQAGELIHEFGPMGLHDHAIHLATLYIEDLADLIQECVDPHFGLSRYAERLGRSARSFDELYGTLCQPGGWIEELLYARLEAHIKACEPALLCLSVPFPGNLLSAFRCGQWIKAHHPHIKVAMGGGFANTELRSLSDPRVFEFLDFVTLDDGEAPIELLLQYIDGHIPTDKLKRTFLLENGVVVYRNNEEVPDYPQASVGTPDYTGLPLGDYISAIEVANPMHSLWSNGRWAKLTMAHGCYWGKCTFCDTSLDYIQRYEPLTAAVLCDRIEAIIAQTGQTGFHFVDEAAPPVLMRSLALELLRRKINISWWANVRFEKAFSRDLCLLLRASGCIAVSGGLEVASDRLLALIQKGITVAQVARVNKHFTEAGIMVHAYLMYGFPTQTAQETIDSLEMVRQMFAAGILQSAFWHRFALTEHSPAGLSPDDFKIIRDTTTPGAFANNDVEYKDPSGTDHDSFAHGLRKSLHNYMHGSFLDQPLHKWFDMKTPKTTIKPTYIADILNEGDYVAVKDTQRVVFTGRMPTCEFFTKSAKGAQWEMCSLTFHHLQASVTIKIGKEQGEWLMALLPQLSVANVKLKTMQEVRESYDAVCNDDFELFWENKPMNTLHKVGLLVL